jgi:pimeloyl-ACP methyl ester carboxylesterase
MLASGPTGAMQQTPLAARERFMLSTRGGLDIALQLQRASSTSYRADLVYVHGATFGADLSIYFPFDGRSWADSLTDAGFAVWGFDFVGYGASGRYPEQLNGPAAHIDDAARDLSRVISAVRLRNGDRPVVLVAHSRGGSVAARYAGEHPADAAALVLFAPIVTRPATLRGMASGTPPLAATSHYPLSVWAQYRRFVEDVPKGQPQVLSEAYMESWANAFLASDPTAASRAPASVLTPSGPLVDVAAMWSGKALFDPARIQAPTLLVRGEWDSSCTDADSARLMSGLGAPVREAVKIGRATHLMHLEQQRGELYAQVNRFLQTVLPQSR